MNEKKNIKYSNKAKGKTGNQKNRRNTSKPSEDKTGTSCDKAQRSANLSTTGRDNDPNWYYTSRDVAEQTSSYAFDRFLGVTDEFDIRTASGGVATFTQATPSIMSVFVNPCPGDTSTIKNGINMAALKMYTTLSSNNAKTTNYAPQDLTMLMLSLGEIISMLEHVRRAFGVAFTYNQRNRSMPSKLLDMMGFEPDSFLTDLAQHRMEFNTWITSINKIPFLSNVAYFYKCADMYQKIYADSTSEMAQIIFMRPFSTWILNEAYNDQGSGLQTKIIPVRASWETIAEIIESMITALFESSTFNYIYADVLNYSAKTGAKLLYMDYLVEGYTVIPEYNRTFSLQVHNSIAIGIPSAISPGGSFTKSNDVACDVNTNKVVYNPAFPSDELLFQELIVDMDTPTPTLEDRIEVTRYQSILGNVEQISNTYYASLLSMADHYVVMYNIDKDSSTYTLGSSFHTVKSTDVATAIADALDFTRLTQFDWNPLVYLSYEGKSSVYAGTILGDLNYYTTLTNDWYSKVNDLTFLALFELR